jgi:glucose/arabinose dehydrogenase/regulation of enolase protein 1 (concanavalin A-like superfamily)
MAFTRESRHRTGLSALAILALAVLAACEPASEPVAAVARAATVPGQFSDTLVTSGLDSPTAIGVAPDGRLFVCQKGGALRVIKDGALLAAPFLSVTVNQEGERGLLGVAFDPAFASERWVYVYYTVASAPLHNRLSRFRASTQNPDVAEAGSEQILLELDNLSSATNHNGGALHFGADGKLYLAVGENANGNNAQSQSNLLGKLLRLDKDGSIPTDNPFYASNSGKNRAIWAYGFRNPFTFDVQPGTGRIFVNDVGQGTWEEIDELFKGANYGWPASEGQTTNPAYTGPVHTYGHTDGACSIIGAAFYNPTAQQFPPEYVGQYFFGDYCAGWIKRLDPSTRAVTGFATGISSLVDLEVAPDGSLLYLSIGGSLRRISYTGSLAPSIASQPASRTVTVGQSATFSVTANGAAPLAYQWQANGVAIPGATSPSYTLANAQLADSGKQLRVVVSNGSGSVTSNAAVLTVTTNQPPTASLSAPTTYTAGTVIPFSATASDPQDGTLPPSAYSFRVDLHHDTHTHPILAPTTGVTSGSFTAGDRVETSASVFYRVTLTVTDSGGLSTTVSRDVQPVKATITLTTVPAGLAVRLDGAQVQTPFTFVGVAGVIRTLEAVSPQTFDGRAYVHSAWSDGKPALHEIATPASDGTFTDTLVEAGAWSDADVGAVGQAGGSTPSGTQVVVTASGNDIWDAADAFHFRYQSLVGDGQISARVVSVGNTDVWAKGGVMIRESLSSGSRHAFMALTSGNGLAFQRRDTTGGPSTHTGATGGSWVRVARSGNTLRGFRSTDGITWTLVGETTQSLPAQVYIGLAVTAHNNAALNTTTFDSVSVENAVTPAFTDGDVGAVGLAGSTAVSGSTFTVRGAGADIYATADSFHYYHRDLNGDGEIRVHVASLGNTNEWAKAGVMIRETTGAGSRVVFTGVTPQHGLELIHRDDTGAATSAIGATGDAPRWVRLVRQGNLFTAYTSADGASWTTIGSVTVSMAASVRVGLAVTSHDTGVINTAVFDSLTVID